MTWVNLALVKFLYYWHIPLFRIVSGCVLLGLGIIYLQLPEAKLPIGVVLTVAGLIILLEAVAGGVGGVGKPKPEPPPTAQQTKPPTGQMKIILGPRPASGS